jgi:hypothetical protein
MTVLDFTQQLEERPNPNIAPIMMHGPCFGSNFYVIKQFIDKSNGNFQIDYTLFKLMKFAVKLHI